MNRIGRGGREEILLKKETGIPLVEIPEIDEEAAEEGEETEREKEREEEKISSSGPLRQGPGERGGQVAAAASPLFSAFVATLEENLQSPEPSRSARPKAPARAHARDL